VYDTAHRAESNSVRLAVTLGDSRGIGPEVAAKALAAAGDAAAPADGRAGEGRAAGPACGGVMRPEIKPDHGGRPRGVPRGAST